MGRREPGMYTWGSELGNMASGFVKYRGGSFMSMAKVEKTGKRRQSAN